MIDLPPLELTPPPSANELWVQAGPRRVKAARYISWRRAAGWEITAWRAANPDAPTRGITAYRIEVKVPFNGRRDLDNYLKPIFDALVEFRVIADDRSIEEIEIARAHRSNCLVKISGEVKG